MWRYAIVTLVSIIFFFLRGGEWLVSSLNANWGYVIDQLGLAIIATTLLRSWLRDKKIFKLSTATIVIITSIIILTHYNSFYRAILDEWLNVIQDMQAIDRGAPAESTGFYITRERYAWAPFIAFHETVGLTKPYSNLILSAFGILMIGGAALSSAWLAGIISGSKKAAMITGLLVGISPNSFASLPWPSSVQGDSLAIILVTFTVGTWILGRKHNDTKGIIIALLFLAAALKGGGSVRTITAGALLVITDFVVFSKDFKPKFLLSWFGAFAITIFFYISNNAVHMAPRAESVSLIVRGAQIMELTTKSFVPPTILSWGIKRLLIFEGKITFVIAFGIIIFALGSLLSLYSFRKRNFKLFTWGWAWFYATAFYAPWFAEGYGTTLTSINDRIVFNLNDMAGFKYAYLPLAGLHIMLGIALANLISSKKFRKVFIVLTIILLALRSYEFLKLDYGWRKARGAIDQEWQRAVFTILPPDKQTDSDQKYLVLLDGPHNPIYSSMFSVQQGLYFGTSVIFYNDPEKFYLEKFTNDNPHLNNVYALAWDSGKLKMLDSTPTFRTWLSKAENVSWSTNNFSDWKVDGKKDGDFYTSESTIFGEKEVAYISPELEIHLPNPKTINTTLSILVKNSKADSAKSTFRIGVLCNSEHGITVRRDLVSNQKTKEDEVHDTTIIIPFIQKSIESTLNGTLSCEGGIIRQIVIMGPTSVSFKLLELQITFPYPSQS